MLSASQNAVIQHLADLAPRLKEAELRVLLYLAADATAKGGTATRRSSREIATATKSARSSVVTALHALAERGAIITREGGDTRAAAHLLPFLELQKMGGPFAGPPPAKRGPAIGPPLVSQTDHPGPTAGPPNAENKRPPTSLDLEPDQLENLDRVLTARPEDFERGELARVSALITWFHEKHHLRSCPSPDAEMCAGILAACHRSLNALESLTIDLHNDRQQGGGGAWWRAVALQRMQKINSKLTAARIAEWKQHRKPKIVAPPTTTPPPATEATPEAERDAAHEEAHNWTAKIAAAAAGKRF